MSLGSREILLLVAFISFLIYTFVGAHFNGHKEGILFASAL